MGSTQRSAFARTPVRLRAHIAASVTAALVLPLLVTVGVDGMAVFDDVSDLLTALALVGVSVVNVEIGRVLDGGLNNSHRPHKALSAWALACAVLLPACWLIPVVTACYTHARWRGLRLQLWKWIGSASFVVLAGVAAHLVALAVRGGSTEWVTDGPRSLAVVLGAVATFLAVETGLFFASAYLNDAEDEVWLRHTLHGARFYGTESAMLLLGGLSAVLWTVEPWLLPLMLPAFGLAQQAALHEPLQQQARMDAKTGLYRYESWRGLALTEHDRCVSKTLPWSVVFADLDQFKPYNDTWGHLSGDAALAQIAHLLRRHLRSQDLVGRFGGEEFCLFLPDISPTDASDVAQRLRRAVEAMTLVDTGARLTMSLGVASSAAGGTEPSLADAISRADEALYVAKKHGRNAVHVTDLAYAPDPSQRLASGETGRPSAHDTSAHDTSAHDTSGHDTSGHDTGGPAAPGSTAARAS